MTTIEILSASARELKQKADEHQHLIAAISEGNDVHAVIGHCCLGDCSHRLALKKILLEAISVMEETRKAFKSKQLETLRKKMIQILAEEA